MKNLLYLVVVLLWYPPIYGGVPIGLILFATLAIGNFDYIIAVIRNNKKHFILFVLFFLSSILSRLFQVLNFGFTHLTAELYIFVMYAVIPLFVFYITSNIKSKVKVERISLVFILSVLMTAYSSILSDVGFNVFDFDRESRMSLSFVKNDIAPTTFSVLLISAQFLLLTILDVKKVFNFIILLFIVLAQLLLATRFAIAGSLFILVVLTARSLKLTTVVPLISGVAVVYALITNVISKNERLQHRMMLSVDLESLSQDESLGTRLFLWSEAIEIAKSAPLGRGYMYFVNNYGKIGNNGREKGWNTHNEFLLHLVGGGWLQLLFLVMILRQLVARIYSISFQWALAAIGLIFFSWFFDTVSNNPGSLNSFYIVFMIFGLLISNYDSENIKTRENL